MLRWLVFFGLLIFQSSSVVAQKSEITLLEERLPTLGESQKMGALKTLAAHYLYVEPEKAISHAIQLNLLAIDKNDSKNLAEGLRILGQALMFKGDHKSAFRNLAKALELAQATEDSHLMSVANRAMGVFYELILDYSKALDYYLRALGYAEQGNHIEDKATIYNNIGNVFNAQGAYNDAIRYFILSAELYARQNNIDMLMNAKVGLSVSYLRSDKLDLAESTLRDVLAEEDKISDFTFSEAMVNLAHVERLKDNYDAAIPIYEFVLNDKKGGSYPPAVAAAYLGLATCYEKTNRLEEARQVYEQGIDKVSDKTTVESEMALFERLAKLEMTRKAFESAALIQDRYISRRNEVQPLTQQRLVGKLETQLAMEKELLRLQNELLGKERDARISTLFMLGAALFALTTIVLFLLLRLRKQALSKLENSNSLLKQMSETDPLTGVGNRRYLQNQLNRHREDNVLLSFLLLDIDHFKDVNDKFGHKQGDDLLRELASLLKSLCRNDEILARIGGEEFVVLLFGVSQTSAVRFAERIRDQIAQTPSIANKQVTVSIGLSFGYASHADYDDLFKQADIALYKAKKEGRDRVEVSAAKAQRLA